jgi:hypothetical protein
MSSETSIPKIAHVHWWKFWSELSELYNSWRHPDNASYYAVTDSISWKNNSSQMIWTLFSLLKFKFHIFKWLLFEFKSWTIMIDLFIDNKLK